MQLVRYFLILNMLLALPALGETTEKTKQAWMFESELELGALYSDNLMVIELEQVSEVADTAAILNGRFNITWQPSDDWTTDFGYSLVARKYQQASEYDLTMHTVYADTSKLFSTVQLGMTFYSTTAMLANERFLQLNQAGIYASKLLNSKVFLRAALNTAEKIFDAVPERDSTTYSIVTDMYYLFQRADNFVAMGLYYDSEAARSEQYDYAAVAMRLHMSRGFDIAGNRHRFTMGARMQWRDYSHQSEDVTLFHNQQLIIDSALNLALNSSLTVILGVETARYTSAHISADYQETSGFLKLRLTM